MMNVIRDSAVFDAVLLDILTGITLSDPHCECNSATSIASGCSAAGRTVGQLLLLFTRLFMSFALVESLMSPLDAALLDPICHGSV